MFPVLLLFCLGYASGQTCQQAGSVCYSVTTAPLGVVGGSCCDACRPYIASGTVWDGTTDWYCMYGTSGGSAGSPCGTYTGSCATNLTCTNSVCTASSTDSDTTSTSSSDTTTGTTIAATTTTTAESCNANAADVCLDSTYGITKTCCSPYTCTSVTSRTSTCQGTELALNQACYEGGVNVGTCASGLLCLDGVCKEASTTCADPVFPNSLCYSADVNRKVADCCSGSYCVQPTSSSDSFCMSFNIGDGLPCGDTQDGEYRGFCDTGLNCISGVCSSNPTTTTTTTTTTTVTTTTVTTTTEACLTSGDTCWSGSGPPNTCCGGAPCPLSTRTCA